MMLKLCLTYLVVIILDVNALTGHVCSRQKAETYQTTYDRAFICPERYTTACGQLDWRRCTKYRVNTCYTPTEKYAVRYRTVEECCPGWTDAGGGQCTLPVCEGRCQNGGVCSTDGGFPACQCPEGYTGDLCQTGRWSTLALGFFVVAVCVALLMTSVMVFLCLSRNNHGRLPNGFVTRPNSEQRERLLTQETDASDVTDSQMILPTSPSAPSQDS